MCPLVYAGSCNCIMFDKCAAIGKLDPINNRLDGKA